MAVAKGLKVVGYFDCAGRRPGGGPQQRRLCRPRHAAGRHDHHRRRRSGQAARARPHPGAEGTLSHKVRVENGVMLVNREIFPIGRKDPEFQRRPRSLRRQHAVKAQRASRPGRRAACTVSRSTAATSTVRRSSTAISATSSAIIDFQNPARPRKVGRWWMPGQWTAGGETPTWEGTDHRCHHPIRLGNRLYTSYWHGGFVILDIDDITKPKFVSGLDWSPPFPVADAHRAAGAVSGARPPHHAGRRRGRGAPRPRLAVLPVDRGHHRRDAADPVRQLPGHRGRRHA